MHRLSFLLLCFKIVLALAISPRLPSYLDEQEGISVNPSDYPALTIDIPIDHYNDSDKRIYQNRYWINSEYYKSGGPIFFFDGGEQNAQPIVPYYLHESAGPSSVMTLARRFKGIAVLFEHRFYGGLDNNGSFPFPMNASGMAGAGYAAYKYLNTEQALEDTVYFANHFKPPGLEQYWDVFQPDRTPWIWIGGSYPGVRGAMMRVRNPETFYATWASSAPTQAAIDMWTYYAQAERSMARNCSSDFTAVIHYVDGILVNGTEAEKDKLKNDLHVAVSSRRGFAPESADIEVEAKDLSNVKIADMLLLPLEFYQYYGYQASVQPFCDILETRNQTHVRTTDNGGIEPAIASESGIAISHNVTFAWETFLVAINEMNCTRPPHYDIDISMYSWAWQYCSEYGYYQRGNPDNPHTIQSLFRSKQFFQDRCNELFPEGLPSEPDVSKPNKYGGWLMNPSNTMFTSGEFDPWRALSPASIEEDSPKRMTTQRIPACNVSPSNDTVFGIIYRDMVHCSDMRALVRKNDINHRSFGTVGFASPINTEPFYAGVGLFQCALEVWLSCFGQGTHGGITVQLPYDAGL